MLFQSEGVVVAKVNLQNLENIKDEKTGQFIGFLAFTKLKCGKDFLDNIWRKKVKISIHKLGETFVKQAKFRREDIKHGSGKIIVDTLLHCIHLDPNPYFLARPGLVRSIAS